MLGLDFLQLAYELLLLYLDSLAFILYLLGALSVLSHDLVVHLLLLAQHVEFALELLVVLYQLLKVLLRRYQL